MYCQITVDCCANGHCCTRSSMEKKAPIFDLITAFVILILGILVICGVIGTVPLIGWFVAGIGTCYLGEIIYKMLAHFKKDNECLQDIYIC